MTRALIAVFVAAAALSAGCSGTGAGPADAQAGDSGPCGAGVYPCGPYGSTRGAVVANMTFVGHADPQHLCKAGPAMQIDLASQRQLSFRDWHLGDKSCPSAKKELLWVIVSAGWCPSCSTEAVTIQQQVSTGTLDPRVAVLEIVFETDTAKQAATPEFLKSWISGFGLTYPVAFDPQFSMGQFFSREATPFNMLVALDTMTIVYRQTGGGLNAIYQAIDAQLRR